MSKKITFFIGGMHGGGAERVISLLANHYCNIGWDVDIVVLLSKKVGYKLDDRIRIVDLVLTDGSYYKRMVKWLRLIRKYVKNERPDRIVSFIGRINVLVLTACLGLKTPIIVSERNDPKHDGRRSFMLKYCNWIYRRANTVVYQTKYEQSCFSDKLKNGVVIANPVRIAVEPSPLLRPFEIVSAGRLLPQKNHAMLISAICILSSKFSDVNLKIYGDGSLREKLSLQIKENNAENFVELCGNTTDLHEKINGAGVFVLCSEYEGLSNALIEAMMLGLVCVSTDYPGAEELIQDGYNGIIVPRGDTQKLADTLAMVLNDYELRNKLAANALASSVKYRECEVINKWDGVIIG